MLTALLRTYHTVKYLRPCQIVGQIRVRLRTQFEDPARLLSKSVPECQGCRWPQDVAFLPPGTQGNADTDILDGRLTFLNRTEEVGWMPNWQAGSLPKLWLYNLHYFEWLWALRYADAKAVVLDWITHHRPGRGQPGWEPYPLSLRAMNLCGVFFARYRSQVDADDPFRKQLWQSLYQQCEWLKGHLETHLLGNHYFENAAALAFVGSCFHGDAAQRWLEKGLQILRVEIPEQILPDGMHFELSPMYHSRVLYVMAILRATGNDSLAGLVGDPLKRMAEALQVLCHPDGQIALLNDSALGVYNAPAQLLDYCRRVEASVQTRPVVRAFSLPDAGYYGWRDPQGDYLVCDFGRIGPDYIPGHAHADLLSYELSLHGYRVIVDAGVHDYEVSELRRYARSTAAHNTVEINELDQCELWGAFRVARRGYPADVRVSASDSAFEISGSHNGYERLKGRPKHTRSIRWDVQTTSLAVHDQVRSRRPVRSVSRIHLHPDCVIKQQTGAGYEIEYPGGTFQIQIQGAGTISAGTGWYCPAFGAKIQNRVIGISAEGLHCEMRYAVRPVPESRRAACDTRAASHIR